MLVTSDPSSLIIKTARELKNVSQLSWVLSNFIWFFPTLANLKLCIWVVTTKWRCFQGTVWYNFSELFDSLIRLLTVLTDPVMFPTSINGNLTKIDLYNKKVIEGFMLEYKQSFHSALLWVKLREKIAQFLRKESTKSSPGNSSPDRTLRSLVPRSKSKIL